MDRSSGPSPTGTKTDSSTTPLHAESALWLEVMWEERGLQERRFLSSLEVLKHFLLCLILFFVFLQIIKVLQMLQLPWTVNQTQPACCHFNQQRIFSWSEHSLLSYGWCVHMTQGTLQIYFSSYLVMDFIQVFCSAPGRNWDHSCRYWLWPFDEMTVMIDCHKADTSHDTTINISWSTKCRKKKRHHLLLRLCGIPASPQSVHEQTFVFMVSIYETKGSNVLLVWPVIKKKQKNKTKRKLIWTNSCHFSDSQTLLRVFFLF